MHSVPCYSSLKWYELLEIKLRALTADMPILMLNRFQLRSHFISSSSLFNNDDMDINNIYSLLLWMYRQFLCACFTVSALTHFYLPHIAVFSPYVSVCDIFSSSVCIHCFQAEEYFQYIISEPLKCKKLLPSDLIMRSVL